MFQLTCVVRGDPDSVRRAACSHALRILKAELEPDNQRWCNNCLRVQQKNDKKDDAGYDWCSKCKQVFYCSRECQLLHWPVHKPECKKIVAARAAAEGGEGGAGGGGGETKKKKKKKDKKGKKNRG